MKTGVIPLVAGAAKINPAEIQRLSAILARLKSWQENPVYSISRITEVTGLSRARVRQLIAAGKFVIEPQNGAQSITLSSVIDYFANRLNKLARTSKRRRPFVRRPKSFQKMALP